MSISDKTQVDKRVAMATKKLTQIGKPFYDHQLEGIKWMMSVEQRGTGGLLCDDPGLGKTYQALALVVSSLPQTTTLIVVPTSIIEQWRQAAAELVGAKAVYVHHGPNRLRHIPAKRVIITTYNLMISDKSINRYYWYRVILDEAHKIKNSQSQSSKMAKSLNATYRWGLTGTPVQNNTAELVNIFRFVTRKTGYVDESNVSDYINSHLIRRIKEVVLKDKIPELQVVVSEICFQTDTERNFYHKVQNNIRSDFTELMSLGGNARDENVAMFELLLRLRQASQHPQLVLDGYTKKFLKDKGRQMTPYRQHSSKHLALIKMLKAERHEPSLVFCHFTQEITMLSNLVQNEGFTTTRFDGKTSSAERATLINNLTRPEFTPPEVLIVQITAGGVGLNLQRYARVYLMSADWNPCNEIQAIARSHRLGQTRPVVVKRLVLVDPKQEFSVIDQRIWDIQTKKRKLMSGLLNEPELMNNGTRKRFNLNRDEYKTLITG
jgi:SNF2 family DNA or RNA helicase